jgi:hypothetical protein
VLAWREGRNEEGRYMKTHKENETIDRRKWMQK